MLILILLLSTLIKGFRGGTSGKKNKKKQKNEKQNLLVVKVSCQCRRLRRQGFDPGAGAEYIVGTQSIVVFERIIKLSLFTKFDKCNVSINEDHMQ